MDTIHTYHCDRCEFQSRLFLRLLRHYQRVHSTEVGFRVVCGVGNCYSDFSSVVCLCRHLRKKHRDFYAEHALCLSNAETDFLTDDSVECSLPTNESGTPPFDVISGASAGSEIELPLDSHGTSHIAMDHIASLSLKLREVYHVPASTCCEIRESMGTMLGISRNMCLAYVQKTMKDVAAPPNVVNAVLDSLSKPQPFEIACDAFMTNTNLDKYVESSFPYVEPVQYVLHDRHCKQQDFMQYVPIVDSLRLLLQNDQIFSSVVNSHQSQDGKLRDICDGSYFCSHPLFGAEDMPVLQIILYYDEFCAVNPLGHRAKKFKIGGFYFVLGNIEPKHRSKLHTVQLAALCFSSAIKKFGFSDVLKPMINDLVALAETGVTVIRPDGEFTFRGSLLIIVADNLAAHALGGFLESFSAVHPCRFCMISKDKMRSTLRSYGNTMRTPEAYTTQVTRATADKSFQQIYGVKWDSCLNVIPHFHTTCAMPSDIMHDMLEGVLCDVIDCVIVHFVQSGVITLQFLNKAIEQFPYSGTDKENKPDVVPDLLYNFKFRQTAAKNRCFLRLLPAMIGHMIDNGDSKWEVLLLFLDLHDAAFSPVMSITDTLLLDDAVESFLHAFTTEFTDSTFKPKMHFLTHYGSHCRAFGPLVNYWSFRFESKHGYFKDITVRMKCRKNILKTLAKKHQYKHCLYLHDSASYLHKQHISTSGGRLVSVLTLPEEVKALVLSLTNNDSVFQCVSVIVDGLTYAVDMAVVLGISNHEISFAQICDIFVSSGQPHLIIRHLNDVEYLRHYHLYSCKLSSSLAAVHVSDLFDPFPLPIYSSDDARLCIVLKHRISCD